MNSTIKKKKKNQDSVDEHCEPQRDFVVLTSKEMLLCRGIVGGTKNNNILSIE